MSSTFDAAYERFWESEEGRRMRAEYISKYYGVAYPQLRNAHLIPSSKDVKFTNARYGCELRLPFFDDHDHGDEDRSGDFAYRVVLS